MSGEAPGTTRRTNRLTDRRSVLAGGLALAALGVVGSACGESAPKPTPVEELLGLLDQAKQDSALAAAAAAAPTPPQVAAALMVVSGQRGAHAGALSAEITRAGGKIAASTSPSGTPTNPSPAEPPEPLPPPPPVSDVIDALRASADNAARLAGTDSGYRAGLLASIAASCTASYTVALAPSGQSI